MNARISRFFSLALISITVTACGSGGDGGNDTSVPSQPKNVSVVAGDAQVTLSWDNVSNATGYDICRAIETITQPTNCSVHQNGALSVDQVSPADITGLTNGTAYFFVVIPKNTSGDGAASSVISSTPIGAVSPTPTGKLNDTAITLCGDYAFGNSGSAQNNLACTLTTDSDGDPIPSGQDAVFGRDASASTNNDNDGDKGFSFTKLDENSFALSDQSATAFSCVKDNVTGLIWEVKQTAAGLHNKDDLYTWFNTSATNNGGDDGTSNAGASCEAQTNNNCNTQAYAGRVNTAGLCGANDWRLPTRKELDSIVHYGRINPAIDTNYFPNTVTNLYWSSSPIAFSTIRAWGVDFSAGNYFNANKNRDGRIRLVRSGP